MQALHVLPRDHRVVIGDDEAHALPRLQMRARRELDVHRAVTALPDDSEMVAIGEQVEQLDWGGAEFTRTTLCLSNHVRSFHETENGIAASCRWRTVIWTLKLSTLDVLFQQLLRTITQAVP